MNKAFKTVEEAIADIKDGSVYRYRRFLCRRCPEDADPGTHQERNKGPDHLLRFRSSSWGLPGTGRTRGRKSDQETNRFLWTLPFCNEGIQHPFEQKIRSGEIELEVYPMGTLAEKYRAAGAGIPAFFTPVGSGSLVEETVLTNIEENRTKKETRMINGQTCILEYALKLDYAFIHAYMGDEEGNVRYRKTAGTSTTSWPWRRSYDRRGGEPCSPR